jgi:hypothetical protein
MWTEFLRATTLSGFGDYRDPVWSNNSCGATVVFEQAAKRRSQMNPAFGPVLAYAVVREQQDVASPLVVSLAVMINEFG